MRIMLLLAGVLGVGVALFLVIGRGGGESQKGEGASLDSESRPAPGPTGRTRSVEGLEFVELAGGRFIMGSKRPGPPELPSWVELSQPRHEVSIEKPIWICRTEVTNEIWERFQPNYRRSAYNPNDLDPAFTVTFDEAQGFCKWLSERAGVRIRLPSEAEWEYACRAGSEDNFTFGDDETLLPEYAWFADNSLDLPQGKGSHPIATRRPNRWGLYDMHGNVLEWCSDIFHPSYNGAPGDGRARASGNSGQRVLRGGSWNDPASFCRSGLRIGEGPDGGSRFSGLRPIGEFEDASRPVR